MNSLLKRYQNIWWSLQPGPSYVQMDRPGRPGVGSVARKHPGVFNLFWLLTSLPEPTHPYFVQHLRANLLLLAGLTHLGRYQVDGYVLDEWAVVHKPKEFTKWLSTRHHTLTPFPKMPGISSSREFLLNLEKAVAELP